MKRKIAMISEHQSPLGVMGGVEGGGQVVYVAELSKHLAALGYEVDVFTRWDDSRLPEIVYMTEGVRVIHMKAGPREFVPKEELLQYMDELTNNLYKFITNNNEEYQVIHANFWMSGLVAANIKRKLGVPYMMVFHALGKVRQQQQGKADKSPSERLEIEKKVADEADRVIAISPQDRDDLIHLYSVDPEKIVMISGGVNQNDFYPIDQLIARIVLKLDPEDRIVLSLGRIVPRKGIDNCIRAIGILNNRYRLKTKLVVVGGEADEQSLGDDRQIVALQRLAQSLGVDKMVKFVGRKSREYLKYYYSAADIFVSTPWYEPFGITPIESMACGTPVIGSNVGGIKYTVTNEKTGYLVSPKNPDQLAEKLSDYFSNPKLAEYFKRNCIRRINESFTWIKVANSFSNLFETMLENKNSDSATNSNHLSTIDRGFEDIMSVARKSKEMLRLPILDAALTIARSIKLGNKVLVCGNGGSAADSQHFAGEFVGRFMLPERRALPVVSLTADTAFMTGWANDINYTDVFARQVEALGRPGDVIVGISTSGNSQNIIEAFRKARSQNMLCIGVIGKTGGIMAEYSHTAVIVPSYNTQRIQEVQINILHSICEIVERQLFTDMNMEELTVLYKLNSLKNNASNLNII